MKICEVDGCETARRYKRWCSKHYAKFRLYGDPLAFKQVKTATFDEALELRTRQDGECLVWDGARTAGGYGSYKGQEAVEHGTQYVHRLVWIRANGSIPPEIQIDHMCWNRACLRLGHLREADRETNCQNQQHEGRTVKGTTGVLGVYLNNKGKYIANLSQKGKTLYVGSYPTLELAEEAIVLKRRELYTPNPLQDAA